MKHSKHVLGDAQLTKPAFFRPHGKFVCIHCDKNYQSRNGLWKHKKKCINNESEIPSEDDENIKKSVISDKELIMMLVKQIAN